MIVNNEIIDSIDNAIMICDIDGSIIKINTAFRRLLERFKEKSTISTVFEIDASFRPEVFTDETPISKQITFNELHINVDVYRIDFLHGMSFMYMFENSIALSETLDSILNLIDDAIGISNGEGILEKVNDTFCRITGTNKKQLIGFNVKELKHLMVTEPITQSVILERKPICRNIKYKNGKTVTYSAKPFLDEKGDIVRIIGTGRDISELVKLEEKLKETERSKTKYFKKYQELKSQFGLDNVVFSSEKMENIIRTAIKAAQTDSTVFLVGESGVGKEVIARLIHDTSLRKDKPFTAINCAAIPAELLETELFGYEEGTFTGAKKSGRRGLLHESNGGTVFLDEISTLPINMQSKLLRVIQENGFTKLGSNKYISLDIRYIAASNLTNEELSNNEIFRQDLYYRLSVIPIYIPPLRERKQDVFPLLKHFLNLFNNKYNSNLSLSREVFEYIYNQDWPGNVRELKNLVERLVILSDYEKLNFDDFLIVNSFGKDECKERCGIVVRDIMPLKEAQLILADEMINRAIEKYGSVVKAAEELNIAPSTIYRKITRGEIHVDSTK